MYDHPDAVTEGIFSKTPTPLEIPITLHNFFKFFGLTDPPPPQKIPILFVGGVWIFSRTEKNPTCICEPIKLTRTFVK